MQAAGDLGRRAGGRIQAAHARPDVPADQLRPAATRWAARRFRVHRALAALVGRIGRTAGQQLAQAGLSAAALAISSAALGQRSAAAWTARSVRARRPRQLVEQMPDCPLGVHRLGAARTATVQAAQPVRAASGDAPLANRAAPVVPVAVRVRTAAIARLHGSPARRSRCRTTRSPQLPARLRDVRATETAAARPGARWALQPTLRRSGTIQRRSARLADRRAWRHAGPDRRSVARSR